LQGSDNLLPLINGQGKLSKEKRKKKKKRKTKGGWVKMLYY
jgi:hypothetical protein